MMHWKNRKCFLKKLNEVKIGRKNSEQEEVIANLDKFYLSREEVLNFLEAILKCSLMLVTMQNTMKLKEQDLKY